MGKISLKVVFAAILVALIFIPVQAEDPVNYSIVCVPADPNDLTQMHYNYNGHTVTLKAVVKGIDPNTILAYRWDADGNGSFSDACDKAIDKSYDTTSSSLNDQSCGYWYQGRACDLSIKVNMPDTLVDAKTYVAGIQVATRVQWGKTYNTQYGAYKFTQLKFNMDSPDQANENQLEIARKVAVDDALWYLHTQMQRTGAAGPSMTGYLPGSGNYGVIENTSLFALAMEENGYMPAYPNASNQNNNLYNVSPYAEDVMRALNFILAQTKEISIDPQDETNDGRTRIPGTTDAKGFYAGMGQNQETGCFSLPVAALAKSGLESSKVGLGNALVQGKPFEYVVQQYVDGAIAMQSDENSPAEAIGGWAPGVLYTKSTDFANAHGIESYATMGWLYALHTAEKEMGASGVYVNNRLKNRMANALYYNQNSDGGCRFNNSDEFPGSFFQPVANYVLASRWLGWDTWDASDNSSAGYPFLTMTKGEARTIYENYIQYMIDHWQTACSNTTPFNRYLWIDGNYNGANKTSSYNGTEDSNLCASSLYYMKNLAMAGAEPIDSLEAQEWEHDLAVSLIKGQHKNGSYTEDGSSIDMMMMGPNGTTAYAAMAGSYPIREATSFHIEPKDLPAAQSGVPYRVELNAFNGVEPYTWEADYLPTGLTIDPETGVISGTPNFLGSLTINVIVIDSEGDSILESMDLNVNPPKLSIVTKAIPNMTVGVPFKLKLLSTGGVPPFTWQCQSEQRSLSMAKHEINGLPIGLKFDAKTGTISGIPKYPGEFTVKISIWDSSANKLKSTVIYKFKVIKKISGKTIIKP